MKTIASFSKIARLSAPDRHLSAVTSSWIERARRWLDWHSRWLQTESLERLNDHLLRDIGKERPPLTRIEEWWRRPPPL